MAKERASNRLRDLFPGNRKDPVQDRAPALPDSPAARAPAPIVPEARAAGTPDGLIERVLSERVHVKPEEARGELTALQGVLQSLSQKTVVVVFALGKVLAEVKAELPHGEFIPWIEENCTFEERSARNYMRVYERYKDEPRRALEELSISEAYVEAGVKKLTASESEGEVKIRGGAAALDGEPGFDEFRSAFRQPTLSGVQLKHYRIAPYRNGTLYVVRPEVGVLPVCNIYVNMDIADPAYQAAITKAHQDVQLALEVFYSKVEELEEQGVVPVPFDSSRKAMVQRMRNVSPEQKKPKAPAKKVRKGEKK